MPSALLRRGGRLAAAAALACATTITGAGVAGADSYGHDHGHQHESETVDIGINTAGIDAPDVAEGGLVKFDMHTDDPAGRELQMLRLHAGTTLDQVFADLAKAINETDPATAAAGIRAVTAEVDAFGGGFVTPQVPEHLTERIDPGTVVLLDFSAFFADPAHPVFRQLELRGDNHRKEANFPHSIVIQQNTAAGPRFLAEDVDRADGDILVHNGATELHEMQIQPIVPGTTDAQIQAFFDAIAKGQNPGPSPFTGPPVGLSAISPDRTVELHPMGLPPGSYVLLCFIPDDQLGIPHAFLGMHQVVQLH